MQLGPSFLKDDSPDLLVLRSAKGRLVGVLVHRHKVIDKHRCLQTIDKEPHMVNANFVDFFGHEQLVYPRRFISQSNQASQKVTVPQAALDQVI